MKRFLVVFFLLFISLQVEAQDSSAVPTDSSNPRRLRKCRFKAAEVEQMYTEIVRNTPRGTTVPAYLPIKQQAEWTVDEASGASIGTALVHGFLRPGMGYYQIIPGLGVGINLNKDDVLYVCVDYGPIESERKVIIHIMEKLNLFREQVRYKRKLVTFTVQPIGSMSTIIERFLKPVPAVGWLYSQFHRFLFMPIQGLMRVAIEELMRYTVNYGVYGVIIRPTEVDLKTELTVALKVSAKNRIKKIAHNSFWLWDNPPTDEEIEKMAENQKP